MDHHAGNADELPGVTQQRTVLKEGGVCPVVRDEAGEPAYAKSLRDQGVPVAEIRTRLIIPAGKNKGKHPSLATVYRLLGEAEPADAEARHPPQTPGSS